MDNSIFKIVELVGSSEISIEDAVQTAVARASKSIKNMKWFNIKEVRGNIEDNKLTYQVVFKVGFEVHDKLQHDEDNYSASIKDISNNTYEKASQSPNVKSLITNNPPNEATGFPPQDKLDCKGEDVN